MNARVTATQVAQLAGVSQSAVSRFFTPGASVAEKTALKVQAAAAELGYRPNALARSLITGKSRIIGLVVAYFENQFYPEAVERLSKALQAHGYHALVFMANNLESVDNVVQEILDYQVDGIVMASVAMSSQVVERCDAAGVPVVLFNRGHSDDAFWSVTSDNIAGGAMAAEHLIDCSARRIGYIAGWEGASTQRDREQGFVDRLALVDQTISAREVGNFHADQSREAALRMFDCDAPPDAVFCANDHMAFVLIDTLRYSLGISVPDEVQVIGFDDVPLAAWPSYQLTTIRQALNRMVESTMDILFARIDQQALGAAKHIQLPCALKVRGTTQPKKE